jgi:DNA polymerase-3 subunit delta
MPGRVAAERAAFPVVLIDGDDATLLAEAVRSVIADLVTDEERDLAVEDFGGDEVDLARVADTCATPPFLSPRRIVVVRDVGRFSTDEVAPVLAYLEDPLPTTVLILVAGGGTVAPKLAAAVKARGHVRSTKVGPREARDWVRARIRAAPLRIDGQAEALIEAHLGEDVSRLGALLEVLVAAYGEGGAVGPAEVEPYLGEAGAVAPWTFTDAIDAGRTADALIQLHRLLGGGERHPLVVLAILHRHVQSLLRVDSPSIQTEGDAAAAMGIGSGRSTYPAKKALGAVRRWGSPAVAEALGLVADAELDLKGASAWPAEAVLEVLVARLCRLARSAVGSPSAGRPSGSRRR